MTVVLGYCVRESGVNEVVNKNLVITIIIIVIVMAGGWFLFKDQLMPLSTEMESSAPPSDTMVESTPTGMMESTDSSAMEGVREFTVTASNFKFDTPEIRVKAGDSVKINFKNAEGFHDFVIDEFNVATKQANAPVEETVTFVADKAGEYEFYCSVGQHRAMGMKGKFIVE